MRMAACLVVLALPVSAGASPSFAGCPLFPADNVWNVPVDGLPRHPNSDAYIATMGAAGTIHPDFGTVWEGAPIGIPYVIVPGTQPKVPVTFDYAGESDPGPYPIPPDAPIEGGSASDGDRHILVVDRDNCILYELYYAYPDGSGGWTAGSGAVYNLASNALRPQGWTSADAAGLPILPGLVRYGEVYNIGEIAHALRFTAPQTQSAYVWPARHEASDLNGAQYPPMGLRLRLKRDFDISGFSRPVQIILAALKKYGMILADNGSPWYISGVPDSRWDDDMLVGELGQLRGSDFEAVDTAALMRDPDSGASRVVLLDTQPAARATATEYYNGILDHYFIATTEDERQAIDGGAAGPGWSRTGAPSFGVWAAPGEGLAPVCRFYGNPALSIGGRRIGPNSHFFTIEPGECEAVKRDPGWIYEGIAFHARRLEDGACRGATRPLYRAYNNGYPARDANHRFATGRSTLEALQPRGWSVEGAVMCVE